MGEKTGYKGAQEYIQEAMKQVWKEIKEGRVLMLRDDGSEALQPADSGIIPMEPGT